MAFDGPLPGWSATGTAFEQYPSQGKGPGQGDITGANGGFINSYHPKLATAATGTLRSPPFELVGDEFVFRISGGRDPKRLHVALFIDGKLTRSATGRQMDNMVRQTWDIRAYRGKMAEVQIVDDSTEPWGYIAVDEIVQWVANDAH